MNDCQFCSRTFKSLPALRNHLEAQHPEQLRELEAIAEDADREMYGADYEHLRDSGWIDSRD